MRFRKNRVTSHEIWQNPQIKVGLPGQYHMSRREKVGSCNPKRPIQKGYRSTSKNKSSVCFGSSKILQVSPYMGKNNNTWSSGLLPYTPLSTKTSTVITNDLYQTCKAPVQTIDLCAYYSSPGADPKTGLKKLYRTVLPFCAGCEVAGRKAVVVPLMANPRNK